MPSLRLPLLRLPRPALAVLALLVAAVLLLGGVLVGRTTAPGDAPRDAVSLGFAEDMQVHHAQAVAMSEALHRRTQDPDLSYLSFDILSTQQGQIGIMRTWLALSPSAPPRGPTMAWMGHRGAMPGMASTAQVDALSTLPLPQAEESYLRLMVRHHEGALGMASYAAAHAGHPQVRALAHDMELGQAAEIELMQGMLRARGLAPVDLSAGDTMHMSH